jgi:hypothetical protein
MFLPLKRFSRRSGPLPPSQVYHAHGWTLFFELLSVAVPIVFPSFRISEFQVLEVIESVPYATDPKIKVSVWLSHGLQS